MRIPNVGAMVQISGTHSRHDGRVGTVVSTVGIEDPSGVVVTFAGVMAEYYFFAGEYHEIETVQEPEVQRADQYGRRI